MKFTFFLYLMGISVFAQSGPISQSNSQPANSLNVQWDCGAKGNGSTDDSRAIQWCINQASSGQTIYFPDGTYQLENTLNAKGGIAYLGQSSNAVLQAAHMGNRILLFPWTGANNITISTLTREASTQTATVKFQRTSASLIANFRT